MEKGNVHDVHGKTVLMSLCSGSDTTAALENNLGDWVIGRGSRTVSNDRADLNINIINVRFLSVVLSLRCLVGAKFMWTIGFQNEGSEEDTFESFDGNSITSKTAENCWAVFS